MSNRYAPNEASCPVPYELLALLLRSDAERVRDIVLQLSPLHRASLAAFAFGRSHMRSLGLVVAAHCDAQSLYEVAGAAGEVLFDHSRNGAGVDVDPARHRKPISLARVAA